MHVQSLSEIQLSQPSLVTIGVFDGVHLGHAHLIRQLVHDAHSSGRLAVVLTFFPHPDVVLHNIQTPYYLTSPDSKAQLLLGLGVDYVITLPFDAQLQQIRAADFIDQLLSALNMEVLCVGADFALGYQREGNVDFLRVQGQSKGFTVHVIDLMMDKGTRISSSMIRQALEAGNVADAAGWLGRSYAISGTVVHGQKRGRLLGFPTANTEVWPGQVLPANGIYASWVWLGSERFMAATNVGVRPMFENDVVTIEPYILDFDRDIYGQTLTITFEKWMRPEMKFDSVAQLITQITADVAACREFLSAQG